MTMDTYNTTGIAVCQQFARELGALLGYFDRRCEALSQYNSDELFSDHVSYRLGQAAGRIDRDRAQRE